MLVKVETRKVYSVEFTDEEVTHLRRIVNESNRSQALSFMQDLVGKINFGEP